MAVAVKTTPESAPAAPHLRLAAASVFGAAYVLGSAALVMFGVPRLWDAANLTPALANVFGQGSFVAAGLQLLTMVAAGLGLYRLGVGLAGAEPPRGLRAGITVTISVAVTLLFVSVAVADNLLVRWLRVADPQAGRIAFGVIAAALFAPVVWVYRQPWFGKFLVEFEEQGWFSGHAYKRTQGLRARRLTMAALLVVAFSGIYTLWSGRWLVGAESLGVMLPYANGLRLTLLPDLQYSVPLFLAAASLWVSWRAINMPNFADFLIATDAEMNKVSWSPWDKLIRDTIVVLVTVVLMTLFLLVVDVVFGWAFRGLGIVPAAKPKTSVSQELDW